MPMRRSLQCLIVLLGLGIGCVPPKPVVIPPITITMRAVAVVVTDGSERMVGALVTLNDITPPGPHTGATGADGVVTFPMVSGSIQSTQVTVHLAGCQPYAQTVELTENVSQQIDVGGPQTTPTAVMAPPLDCLPPPPTRDQALKVCMSFQGLTVYTQQYGSLPWFEAALAWLDIPEDREAVYEAKRNSKNLFCPNGDTHAMIFTPWGPPLYDEAQQAYTADKFGPRDWTNHNTEMDPKFAALVAEVREAGFIPVIVGSGDGVDGYERVTPELPLILSALARWPARDLQKDVVFVPGFDGVFYGWEPSHVKIPAFGRLFRQLCPDCYLLIEHGTGHIPIGEGDSDWVKGGDMQAYDGLLSEFDDDRFDDSVWQIAARTIGPAYMRPPDQPASDDRPPVPWYLRMGTERGPFYVCAFEFGTYGWVRAQYDAAHVQDVQRAYFKRIGYSCGG